MQADEESVVGVAGGVKDYFHGNRWGVVRVAEVAGVAGLPGLPGFL